MSFDAPACPPSHGAGLRRAPRPRWGGLGRGNEEFWLGEEVLEGAGRGGWC